MSPFIKIVKTNILIWNLQFCVALGIGKSDKFTKTFKINRGILFLTMSKIKMFHAFLNQKVSNLSEILGVDKYAFQSRVYELHSI